MNTLPEHVAIIMDGNGRWAEERGLDRIEGHRAGAQSLRGVIEECGRLGIPYLTVFAFSTENWGRPREEVQALMTLMAEFSRSEADELRAQDVRVVPIGDLDSLSEMAREGIAALARFTEQGQGLTLLLAVNYGGRSDLAQAARTIAQRALAGEIDPDNVNDHTLQMHLYSHPYPDPDLIIRTGGEWRLSNFYLYQAAYSEFFSSDAYWPDFGPDDLRLALDAFEKRQRRFGGRPRPATEGG